MKKTILILSLFLASCGSSSIKPHDAKSDTTTTLILYLNTAFNARIDLAYRIIKDTFSFDTVNAETAKRVWKKDTLYFVPIAIPRSDSAGKLIKDSAGNVKQDIQYVQIRNNNLILQDYNKHP